jgi:glyoxylase-like metal-dependent hydrolase (beta-lactamase superfamily II)
MKSWTQLADNFFLENILFLLGYGSSSNIYLIKNKELTLIDTGNDYTAFLELFEKYNPKNIKNIFITHAHYDHSAGLLELLRMYPRLEGVKVYVHNNVSQDLKSKIGVFDRDIEIIPISGGEKLKLSEMKFKAIYTPGHTIDSISLYHKKSKTLFSGDSISIQPIIDKILGGDLLSFIASLRLFKQLKIKAILPGHGFPALKDTKEIIEKAYLNSILALHPSSRLKDAALIAFKKGMVEETIYALKEHLKLEKEDTDAMEFLASILADVGRHAESLEIFKQITDITHNPFTHYLAGIAALKAEKFDYAIEEFKAALKQNANFSKAKIGIGVALYEKGLIKEALNISEFREAFEKLKLGTRISKKQ